MVRNSVGRKRPRCPVERQRSARGPQYGSERNFSPLPWPRTAPRRPARRQPARGIQPPGDSCSAALARRMPPGAFWCHYSGRSAGCAGKQPCLHIHARPPSAYGRRVTSVPSDSASITAPFLPIKMQGCMMFQPGGQIPVQPLTGSPPWMPSVSTRSTRPSSNPRNVSSVACACSADACTIFSVAVRRWFN